MQDVFPQDFLGFMVLDVPREGIDYLPGLYSENIRKKRNFFLSKVFEIF